MTVAVVVLASALLVVIALLTAAGAGKLARMDGASHPAAVSRAATAFAAVITLAAAVTGTLAALLTRRPATGRAGHGPTCQLTCRPPHLPWCEVRGCRGCAPIVFR